MREGRARLLAVFTIVGAVAIFAGSAVYFWKALPPTTGLLGAPVTWTPASGGPTDLPSALAPVSLAGVRVAVLENQENERVTPAGFYAGEVARWKELLTAGGATLSPVSAADVLVLPHALCASVPLRLLVARHLERGGGVVTTGMTGAFDGRCQPDPDTLVADLVGGGVGVVRPLQPSDSGSYYAVARGETAIAAGIPPGARVEIRPSHQVAFAGPARDVYYTDYLRAAAPAPGDTSAVGAVVRSRVGPGRVVAFGFGLSHLVEGWSRHVGEAMALNAVAWAGGRPVAQLASWPGGAAAAVVLAQDVEQQYRNANRVAEVMEKEKVPGTFFILGADAEAHLATTHRVEAYVEVGSHTVTHEDLRGMPLDRQVRNLAWAQREMVRLVGHPAVGLRPPEEQFDLATMQAWDSVGGAYIFGANNLRTAGPEIVPLAPVRADSMVLLVRSGVDDYYLLATEGLRDRGDILRRLVDQVDDAARLRGVYTVSFHSHLLGTPELVGILDAFVRDVRRRGDVWFASARDVAVWWRQRYAVTVEPSADGSSVRLLNTGSVPVRDAVVIEDLPDGRSVRAAAPVLEPGRPVVVQMPGVVAGADSAAQDIAPDERGLATSPPQTPRAP